MASIRLKNDIISRACEFNTSGLSVGKSGNISVRCKEGFLITPTGFSYAELTVEDLTHCDFAGNLIEGKWKPSSEWPFHAAIYQARSDVHAIVHCHSPYATALACCRKPIPPFHYMVAISGAATIACAEYATFGSVELSENAVAALADSNACLLANHGQIAVGASVAEAYSMAHEVESLANQYCISLQAGVPILLDEEEMAINIEKFKHYGKQQERK